MMKGRLWFSDSYLLSLKAFDGCTPLGKIEFSKEQFWIQLHNLILTCMDEEIGRQIGQSIGEIEECDMKECEIGWGRIL